MFLGQSDTNDLRLWILLLSHFKRKYSWYCNNQPLTGVISSVNHLTLIHKKPHSLLDGLGKRLSVGRSSTRYCVTQFNMR